MNNRAVILFSGGIDSTTALYWGMRQFTSVFCLVFDYDQVHNVEVKMAQIIAAHLNVDCQVVNLPFRDIVSSALVNQPKKIPDSMAGSKDERGVPITYVPFRNGIFISMAAAVAESRSIFNIITGFNLIDTPDYPDTTMEFTRKMEAVLNQGTSAKKTGNTFKIHTPLIHKSKAEIIQMGLALGADYAYSVSCYRGDEIPCMSCPSCDIRNQAFNDLAMEDPLINRLKEEDKL